MAKYYKGRKPNKLLMLIVILLIGGIGMFALIKAADKSTNQKASATTVPAVTTAVVTTQPTEEPTITPDQEQTIDIGTTVVKMPSPTRPDKTVSYKPIVKPTGDSSNPSVTTKTAIPTPSKTPAKDEQSKDSPEIAELKKLTGLKTIPMIKGMVNLHALDKSIVFDIRYATSNNFVGKPVYSANVCVAHPKMALKVVQAHKYLKKQGYGLKVWDAYRPISDHKVLQKYVDDPRFISAGISGHCKGTTIDVTMVDSKGKEVKMPSKFDEFNSKAYRNSPMSKEVKNNLKILTDAMTKYGFVTYQYEWWHFTMSGSSNYKAYDYDLAKTFPNWVIK